MKFKLADVTALLSNTTQNEYTIPFSESRQRFQELGPHYSAFLPALQPRCHQC